MRQPKENVNLREREKVKTNEQRNKIENIDRISQKE